MVIKKAKETMSAKQRVLKTFNLERTDRVTIGYDANQAVHDRFAKALNIKADDRECMLQALGVDYRYVGAPYIGPMLYKELPDRVTDPVDGFNMRWISHQSGGYWDFCDFPLAGADDETISRFPVANPNDFDYRSVAGQIEEKREYALFVAGNAIPDIINATGRVMGMEDTLYNLAVGHEATLDYINRRVHMHLSILERILAEHTGKIDFMWLGEDLGTQIAPMISLDMFRSIFRPILQRFVDLAKAYKLPVMIHTCGSSSWAYEDFIKIGINAVDTLQPEAANMSPTYLKEHFGNRLSFRGCLSTAGPLSWGSVDEVIADVKSTLAIMMNGYGYHFATTHSIQDNTPTENVIALYNSVHQYGVYP